MRDIEGLRRWVCATEERVAIPEPALDSGRSRADAKMKESTVIGAGVATAVSIRAEATPGPRAT